MTALPISYVLPIRVEQPRTLESDSWRSLAGYLRWLVTTADEVIVVDGSEVAIRQRVQRFMPLGVRHVPLDPDARTTMGKVGGVITGLRCSSNECVVIADDDVRYDAAGLGRMAALLRTADLVRPQNFFEPLPWHARWDTARSLLNRLSGGDWPGTMGVRRELFLFCGGYDGEVMFENLELERTMCAHGARVQVALDLYVRRLPPSTRQFLEQRVRQAYDELARPARLLVQLALLPTFTLLARRQRRALILAAGAAVAAAEAGRRRAGGAGVFPVTSILFAPLWVGERAICAWLAVGSQLLFGGVRYRGHIVPRAAHSMAQLHRAAAVRAA